MGARKCDVLTDADVDALPPSARPYKRADGKGLFVLTCPNGSKYWRLKYRYMGRENTVSLGVFPEITVAVARERRDEARNLLANGLDPLEIGKLDKAKRRDEAARLKKATRFSLDNTGALTAYLGNRALTLTGKETAELRAFLLATQNLTPEV